jgi:hypothetical protein
MPELTYFDIEKKERKCTFLKEGAKQTQVSNNAKFIQTLTSDIVKIDHFTSYSPIFRTF